MTPIPFRPSNNAAPPFIAQVTLDGNAYSLITMWNMYRPGWYVLLVDQGRNVFRNQPLIGSPNGSDIPLFPGTFTTSTILYREPSTQFEIGP